METILKNLAQCIERGKVARDSPYPPDMKDQDGADELTAQALEAGVSAGAILNEALIVSMGVVGAKFSEGALFVPDLLMAAKAMKASMEHLKPYIEKGEVEQRGTFVVGTVQGDLHDIGKNLVCMMMEGGGYKVVDLGVDVPPEKFVEAVRANPGCIVGLSALLTTTMVNMDAVVEAVRAEAPDTQILIGGAPVTQEFADQIGANSYSPDPQGALDYLETAGAA